MNISAVMNPESLRSFMRRALRRDSIERIIHIAKWTLTAIATAIVTATVVQIINIQLAIKADSIKLTNDIMKLSQQDETQPVTTTKPDFSVITKKNVFGALGPKTPINQATGPKPPTKLPLTLIGTFLQDGSLPYAIIEDDKKKVQDVFNINDMVFGDAKLVSIRSDSVEINRAGQIEILQLDDAPDAKGSAASASSDGEEVSVDEKELTQALDNLPLLLTQARAVPYFKDGKAVGLRLFAIKSGSLYEKVGLQNGDILKTINGSSLSDISQAMKLFETLRTERSISVSLERNREDKEFRYQIK